MARSILTLFPNVGPLHCIPTTAPQWVPGIDRQEKTQSVVRGVESAQGNMGLPNGTFITECCVVIGWLQEAGTSSLSVVVNDHSL